MTSGLLAGLAGHPLPMTRTSFGSLGIQFDDAELSVDREDLCDAELCRLLHSEIHPLAFGYALQQENPQLWGGQSWQNLIELDDCAIPLVADDTGQVLGPTPVEDNYWSSGAQSQHPIKIAGLYASECQLLARADGLV